MAQLRQIGEIQGQRPKTGAIATSQ